MEAARPQYCGTTSAHEPHEFMKVGTGNVRYACPGQKVRLIHSLKRWDECTSKQMEPVHGRWSIDSHTSFRQHVTCSECKLAGLETLMDYPKDQNEDRQNKAEGKYILPYDMFCFGNPMYADCHMAGSCRRRDRSCSE